MKLNVIPTEDGGIDLTKHTYQVIKLHLKTAQDSEFFERIIHTHTEYDSEWSDLLKALQEGFASAKFHIQHHKTFMNDGSIRVTIILLSLDPERKLYQIANALVKYITEWEFHTNGWSEQLENEDSAVSALPKQG